MIGCLDRRCVMIWCLDKSSVDSTIITCTARYHPIETVVDRGQVGCGWGLEQWAEGSGPRGGRTWLLSHLLRRSRLRGGGRERERGQ